jgi:hypothetical protein
MERNQGCYSVLDFVSSFCHNWVGNPKIKVG